MARSTDRLEIRALRSADELPLFCGLRYSLDHELPDDLRSGVRRPEWMWVALRDRRLLARAAWSGDPSASSPSLLDFLDIGDTADRVPVGVCLISQAHAEMLAGGTTPPDYVRFVAPDWRKQLDTRRLTSDLIRIVGETGARLVAERFRFQW